MAVIIVSRRRDAVLLNQIVENSEQLLFLIETGLPAVADHDERSFGAMHVLCGNIDVDRSGPNPGTAPGDDQVGPIAGGGRRIEDGSIQTILRIFANHRRIVDHAAVRRDRVGVDRPFRDLVRSDGFGRGMVRRPDDEVALGFQ